MFNLTRAKLVLGIPPLLILIFFASTWFSYSARGFNVRLEITGLNIVEGRMSRLLEEGRFRGGIPSDLRSSAVVIGIGGIAALTLALFMSPIGRWAYTGIGAVVGVALLNIVGQLGVDINPSFTTSTDLAVWIITAAAIAMIGLGIFYPSLQAMLDQPAQNAA